MISAMVGARSTFCQLRREDLVGGARRCTWVSGSRLVIPGSVIGCSVFTPAMAAVLSCWASGSARCWRVRAPIPRVSNPHPAGHIPLVDEHAGHLELREVETAVLRVEVLVDLLNARLLVVVLPRLRERGTDPTAHGSPAERRHGEDAPEHAEKIRRAEIHEGSKSRAGGEVRLRGIRFREDVILGHRGTPFVYRHDDRTPARSFASAFLSGPVSTSASSSKLRT